jgi:hypothetical protein
MTALSGGWSVPAVCGSFPPLSIGSNPSKKVTGFLMEQCKVGLWDCENILQNGVESLGRGGSFQEVASLSRNCTEHFVKPSITSLKCPSSS